MSHNLLSKLEKRKLSQEYYLRLLSVCTLLFSFAVVVGLVAIFPAYIDVADKLSSLREEENIRQKEENDTDALQNEIGNSVQMISFLEQDFRKEKYINLLDEALRKRPEGILITGFSYNRTGRLLTLQGIAEKRELVVSYAHSLEASNAFENVPVPIANLAKNTDLEFTLSLTIATTTQQ